MNYEELAKKAWKLAVYCNETDRPNIGMEWAGIAKLLEEIDGIRNWGIIESLKKIEV